MNVPDDVRRLVIAARKVAFDWPVDDAALKQLDAASEAFASRVPWEDQPTEDEISKTQPPRRIKMKLSSEQRDEVIRLLGQHDAATSALKQVSKPKWFSGINLSQESSNEYIDVSLDLVVAKAALKAQLESIVGKLAKLGIEME